MITLTDSIEIKATPEKVFNFFTGIKTAKDYRAWHPDHVEFVWLKGEPFQEGSIVYFEEYLHGRLHKLKFVCTKVVPNRLIEYRPTFPLSLFAPKNQFIMEPKGKKGCVFTATGSFRAGPLFKKLGRRQLEGTKQHMKEEGESLKKILESQ
ncbi:MAG: SRPBCC family protein [Chloroflexota bacterium]